MKSVSDFFQIVRKCVCVCVASTEKDNTREREREREGGREREEYGKKKIFCRPKNDVLFEGEEKKRVSEGIDLKKSHFGWTS
jgi:hypothetical protein